MIHIARTQTKTYAMQVSLRYVHTLRGVCGTCTCIVWQLLIHFLLKTAWHILFITGIRKMHMADQWDVDRS